MLSKESAEEISSVFRRFSQSLDNHQLKPTQGFALMVTLLDSQNRCLHYPVKGMLHVIEQGWNMGVSQAVFHQYDNGRLGPPVVVKNPHFEYGG